MTSPSSAPVDDGIDANDAYAELSRQFGLAMGQIVQLQMLVAKRDARIVELEVAVRMSQPTESGDRGDGA